MGASPASQSSPSPAATLRTQFFHSNAWLISVLIFCAMLPYANTLLNDFAFDDNTQVLENPYIQSFRHVREIFTTTVWSYVGTESRTNYYRPIMTFGYLLTYELFGPKPGAFHLVNILLHAAVVCVLFVLSLAMFRDRALAFLAALIFALHPVHSESVAWIAAVTDLELTLFYLLAFLCFLKLGAPGRRGQIVPQVFMMGSFILALLSKEQALTLPLLAMVYEHAYRGDRATTALTQKLFRYGPLWLLAGAYLAVRIWVLGAFAPVSRFQSMRWYETFLTGIGLIGPYLGKLVWPVHLSIYYVVHKPTSLRDPHLLAGASALLFCAWAFDELRKRERLVSFGFIWFGAALAPVLNVRWLGGILFGERYLYLPSVGFCWIAAWGCLYLWKAAASGPRTWKKALALAGIGVSVLCILRIVTRNGDWRNDVVLFSRSLARTPEGVPMHASLGVAYFKQGNFEAAEHEWLELLKHDPRNYAALNDLGIMYSQQGRYAEAADCLNRAIKQAPGKPALHVTLAGIYLDMGSLDSAESEFRAALVLSPIEVRAHAGLGTVYWRRGQLKEAEQAFRRALDINPSAKEVHYTLGTFYAANGRTSEAAQEFQRVLRLDPDNREAVAALLRLSP